MVNKYLKAKDRHNLDPKNISRTNVPNKLLTQTNSAHNVHYKSIHQTISDIKKGDKSSFYFEFTKVVANKIVMMYVFAGISLELPSKSSYQSIRLMQALWSDVYDNILW